MIRRRSLFCNIKFIKNPKDSLFTYSEYPDLSRQKCPACKAQGWFKKHGSYERYVIDLQEGRPVVLRISIPRVKCDCGHTHALLKDAIIPYCQYSLRFMIQVLKSYFRHKRTVAWICEQFQITPPTLYRWKNLFLSNRRLMLGLLLSKEKAPLYFLHFIDRIPILSDFLCSFFAKTSFSFLQSHANPAYS